MNRCHPCSSRALYLVWFQVGLSLLWWRLKTAVLYHVVACSFARTVQIERFLVLTCTMGERKVEMVTISVFLVRWRITVSSLSVIVAHFSKKASLESHLISKDYRTILLQALTCVAGQPSSNVLKITGLFVSRFLVQIASPRQKSVSVEIHFLNETLTFLLIHILSTSNNLIWFQT